jgi:uncharacterized protein YcgI (DUF1989 family)
MKIMNNRASHPSNCKHHIPPQSGTALLLKKGEVLRIIDPAGEQVADVVAFSKDDSEEFLSSGRTIEYAGTIYLTKCHTLYSNRSNPMFHIINDKVGHHDFLLTPCSRETFKIIYNYHDDHPSCFANLVAHLSAYGIRPDQIPTTFNVFMNVQVAADGTLTIAPPTISCW